MPSSDNLKLNGWNVCPAWAALFLVDLRWLQTWLPEILALPVSWNNFLAASTCPCKNKWTQAGGLDDIMMANSVFLWIEGSLKRSLASWRYVSGSCWNFYWYQTVQHHISKVFPVGFQWTVLSLQSPFSRCLSNVFQEARLFLVKELEPFESRVWKFCLQKSLLILRTVAVPFPVCMCDWEL